MDFKSASEAVGLLGKLTELKDNFTGKTEIRGLKAQLAVKDKQLEAENVAPNPLDLPTGDLAIIGISSVAIVAIIAIIVIAIRYQPAMMRT